jgi:hypothetical protein
MLWGSARSGSLSTDRGITSRVSSRARMTRCMSAVAEGRTLALRSRGVSRAGGARRGAEDESEGKTLSCSRLPWPLKTVSSRRCKVGDAEL